MLPGRGTFFINYFVRRAACISTAARICSAKRHIRHKSPAVGERLCASAQGLYWLLDGTNSHNEDAPLAPYEQIRRTGHVRYAGVQNLPHFLVFRTAVISSSSQDVGRRLAHKAAPTDMCKSGASGYVRFVGLVLVTSLGL